MLCNNILERKRKYEKMTDEEKMMLFENGISKKRFYSRLTSGWSRQKALSVPVMKYKKITDEERRLMEISGVDNHTFRSRVSRNMDRIEAATKPKRQYNYK